MIEVWRQVPSLPRLMVSTEGKLMVIPYQGDLPNDKGLRPYGGKPTYGQWDGARYIYVEKGRTYKVARLVCEAFNGKPSKGKNVCMHLDENSRNNKPDNLAWGTQKENLNFPGFIKYCQTRTGAMNPFIKGRLKQGGTS